ncbi:MAG: hypothetical protein FJX75_06490 [Armatimonadetes bacterium]|nr:hypothetical protein [Armatimonadota bacterium]
MSPSPEDPPPPNDYEPAEVYLGLRRGLFGVVPSQVGLSREGGCGEVWGLLMETGYPEAAVTLVAVADGTVSLYFSNGGGTLGLGAFAGPRKASEALLQAAPRFMAVCQPTTEYPLPGRGHTRFYLLTFAGVLTAEAIEEELGYNRHPMSPLFHLAHQLIAEIRVATEGLQAQAGTAPEDE